MTQPPLWKALFRGFWGRCPNCGGAGLFQGYLKQVDACPVCHHPWAEIRADDGPAWATILLTGHLIAPLIAFVAMRDDLSEGVAMALLGAIALALCLGLLPRSKGFFIALIWLRKADGEG